MQTLGSKQQLKGAEAEPANPRMDKLFQNREHEGIMWASGQQHTLPSAYVHLETLENTAEQGKEPDEAGCTPLGGI